MKIYTENYNIVDSYKDETVIKWEQKEILNIKYFLKCKYFALKWVISIFIMTEMRSLTTNNEIWNEMLHLL
jgi:plasmid rolling circle replication initiator protein Rep